MHPFRREEHKKGGSLQTEAALEVIGAFNIARGKEFVIPVPSKGITAEERLMLKRCNRKFSQKSRVGSICCWFSRWVQLLCIKTL